MSYFIFLWLNKVFLVRKKEGERDKQIRIKGRNILQRRE